MDKDRSSFLSLSFYVHKKKGTHVPQGDIQGTPVHVVQNQSAIVSQLSFIPNPSQPQGGGATENPQGAQEMQYAHNPNAGDPQHPQQMAYNQNSAPPQAYQSEGGEGRGEEEEEEGGGGRSGSKVYQ